MIQVCGPHRLSPFSKGRLPWVEKRETAVLQRNSKNAESKARKRPQLPCDLALCFLLPSERD